MLRGQIWSQSAYHVKVVQSCLILCDPMDYAVHGILWARILEWVAFPFPKGFSQSRDQIQASRIAGRFFTSLAAKEAHILTDTVNTEWDVILVLKSQSQCFDERFRCYMNT